VTEFQPAETDGDSGDSQTVRAQRELRGLILSGALAPGGRLVEQTLVERLGVSRTPIRAAMQRLEQEGLLQALAHGGFAVRLFSEQEAADAIELRGTLEGLAARLAAERGAAPALVDAAEAALADIDAVLRRPTLDDAAFERYVEANARFHAVLHQLCASEVLAREIERVARLPFASPSAFVMEQAHTPHARDMLVVAQDQHRQVLAAIARREGARAESLVREHARIAQRNLRAALAQADPRSPGVGLLRPAPPRADEPVAQAATAARPRGRPRRAPASAE
jgi:GntR family transcriptional regulator of vanillate catabolism